MGLDSTVLRAMADAGASTDVILAAIEAQAIIDANRLAAQRAGNAERQQRLRDRRALRRSNGSNALRTVTPPIEEIIPPGSSDDEHIPARKAKPAKPEGVADQTWRDFLEVRRAKKAPLTTTALTGIATEAGKAGWSMEAALTECVARNWQAFKADWVAGKPNAANDGSYLDHLRAKRAAQGP